jgi:hypothetical protein
MEVAYAIIATAAHMEPDGRLFLLNGGLEHIHVVYKQGVQTMLLSLAGKITFPPEECGREHEVQIELCHSDGEVIESVTPDRVTPLVPRPPSRLGTASFLLHFLGIPFRKEGRHLFRILVDGHRLREVDFNVTITGIPPEEA